MSNENENVDVSEQNMGGMGDLFFKTLGFSQENIDSIRSIIDSINVTDEGDKNIINVALKNVKVIIEK